MNTPSPASVVAPQADEFSKVDASIIVHPGSTTRRFDNDIDERDSMDPLCATDYVQDLYKHFRSQELTIPKNNMGHQQYIDEQDRAILIDWLVQLHYRGSFVPKTLFLAVNIIDRYFSRKQVTHERLELVGITALWIACKYEEAYDECLPVHLDDFIDVCEDTYSIQEVFNMEADILKKLKFRISVPTAHVFLVRFLKGAYANETTSHLANYILEGTLFNNDMQQRYLPSQLAAASTMIAHYTQQGGSAWSQTLWQFSGYRQQEVEPVARAILEESESVLNSSVGHKYLSYRFDAVAIIPLCSDI